MHELGLGDLVYPGQQGGADDFGNDDGDDSLGMVPLDDLKQANEFDEFVDDERNGETGQRAIGRE